MKYLMIILFTGSAAICFAQTHHSMNWYNTRQGHYSGSYEYTIVLKNDSIIRQKTPIDQRKNPHSLLVDLGKRKKRVILPGDTREISRITPEGYTLTGIPADSCWYFKVVEAKINVYSNLAEPWYEWPVAIQSGEHGPILPLTLETLRMMIGETTDPKLEKLLKKGKIHAALKQYNGHASE